MPAMAGAGNVQRATGSGVRRWAKAVDRRSDQMRAQPKQPNDGVRRALIAGFLCVLLWPVASAAGSARGNLVMRAAPDFVLKALSGQNLRLSEYRGDVVLLEFWASWCGRCQEQLPVLTTLERRFADSRQGNTALRVLSVNLDRDPERARAAARHLRIDFPILMDDRHSVAALYDLGKMPQLILIDPRGKVRWMRQGYRKGDAASYVSEVADLLAE